MTNPLLGVAGEFGNVTWIDFLNNSGEEIPAHSVVKVTGYSVRNNRTVLTVEKPDAFGRRSYNAISYMRPVADGKYGQLTFNESGIVWASQETGGTDYAQIKGPVSGSWELKHNVPGYRKIGSTVGGLCVVRNENWNVLRCTLDGALASAGTATASVFVWNSSGSAWVDTAYNITVRESIGVTSDVASGDVMLVNYESSTDSFIPSAAECSA